MQTGFSLFDKTTLLCALLSCFKNCLISTHTLWKWIYKLYQFSLYSSEPDLHSEFFLFFLSYTLKQDVRFKGMFVWASNAIFIVFTAFKCSSVGVTNRFQKEIVLIRNVGAKNTSNYIKEQKNHVNLSALHAIDPIRQVGTFFPQSQNV